MCLDPSRIHMSCAYDIYVAMVHRYVRMYMDDGYITAVHM